MQKSKTIAFLKVKECIFEPSDRIQFNFPHIFQMSGICFAKCQKPQNYHLDVYDVISIENVTIRCITNCSCVNEALELVLREI